MREYMGVFLVFILTANLALQIDRLYRFYTIPKSEYNELRQDGKVWAYVRKDGKL